MSGYEYQKAAGIAGLGALTPHGIQQVQVAAQANFEPQAPPGILLQARNNIDACHRMLDDLHKFADQYVGIRNEAQAANAPMPVPNGAAEEMRDYAGHLQSRLRALCDRLSVL